VTDLALVGLDLVVFPHVCFESADGLVRFITDCTLIGIVPRVLLHVPPHVSRSLERAVT